MTEMREVTKDRLSRLLRGLVNRAGVDEYAEARVRQTVRQTEKVIAAARQESQILLRLAYQDRAERGARLPEFDDVEFKVYSQNGEDGILLFIFSLVGTSTKKTLEIGAANGIECNSGNLIINHGWRGLLIDGDEARIGEGNRFYRRTGNTSWYPPELVHAWVTRENVNELVRDHGFAGEVDLLSLDLDGIDYWIWEALESVQPRVIVAEYNWTWGPEAAVTIPYEPHFALPPRTKGSQWDEVYFGASLSALVKLGRKKGYRLVGGHRWGVNAFFIRDGLNEDQFPTVTPAECFETPAMKMLWNPSYVEAHDVDKWVWI